MKVFMGMGTKTFISVLLVSTALFVSCSPVLNKHPSFPNETLQWTEPETNSYGAYLAGRVAHIRKDFKAAASYYKSAYVQDETNPQLIDRLYLLLASQGNIDEAAVYAQKAIDLKTSNNFAYLFVASKQMHDEQYKDSIKTLQKINDPIYKALISPLMNAWNYAGLKQSKKAFAELDKLGAEDAVAKLHRAMLYDFLGKNREAKQAYEAILNDKNSEVSVRMLELITNFYIRIGQKEKAVSLMKVTMNAPALDSLLTNLRLKVEQANPSETQPILRSAKDGAAEGLFIIASTFKLEDIIDVAHVYTALAVYMNPHYSTAKVLLADIFSARDMYDEASALYDDIDKDDIAYYAAQMKKANNLIRKEDFRGAEILLKSLSDDYEDQQIYIKLGDILRYNKRFKEAIQYYDKALKDAADSADLWPIYYAKGIAEEQSGQWKKAEKSLLKAYELNKHYLVLNYLGYSWMRQNKNVEQAFEMIVHAYNQAPYDPSINDSVGFALYNLGYYGQAIPYLEKAVEMYPSSAIISSHLGDAYWFAHRQNEAKFQWKHALDLKDDSGELDRKETEAKIEDGNIKEPSLQYDKAKIEEIMKKIKKPKLVRRVF